ncbi:PREDICTED: tissue factor pathway inhibitor isoform X1 [Gavialis gangeticus]|uniref:tissue factor pathway inhibitor isoform X1 n=1 Tax=Gavialis gangeticus TaxID=94835 RepID=UPI00092E42CD|nr:PREDICTED: tissue factor pathway inhibitor isoform X1 [Gavialis gangeticus]XP_019378612.1 PREDICTED: tissue factor pathway inhibitor isoform X1 [Gavialis gangeticus]
MNEMKRGCVLVPTLFLLLSCIPWQVTADPEDGEDEDIPVAVSSPLKLGHSICAMKLDEGPCKAILVRYYFNIQNRKCETFEYGGCKGNENNFLTLEECEKKCVVTDHPMKKKKGKFNTEKPKYCFLEQDAGICRGYIPRFFYNKDSRLCEKFWYGGCLGNQNNFWSLEDCQRTCQDSFISMQDDQDIALPRKSSELKPNNFPRSPEQSPLPSFCMSPMDRGLCRANELRYFFNPLTGKCRPFGYSGCGGNENNFISRKSCIRTCMTGFSKKQGKRGLLKIKRKRKKQPEKVVRDEIIIERI